MSAFWDHVLDLIWAPILAVISWAFLLDRRVSRLETQREAMVEDIADIRDASRLANEKLDKLIDKLL